LIGDPYYPVSQGRNHKKGNRSFLPLPFSRKEALAIAREAQGNATCFLGREANSGLVLQGGLRPFRMLHFSVHSLLAMNDPQESALVLSSVDPTGRKIERLVHAGEIARLDLPADLVVLSACSTGLGAEIRGEGLVGLTQAFFSAGASSVVASLWDVHDLGTSELMTYFYRNLLRNKLPPAAALREAQLTLRKQKGWSSPYYWSGFVLQGEWR
jgi:CHAT domain-containing protein